VQPTPRRRLRQRRRSVFGEKLNHHTTVTGGILAVEAGRLLSEFFAARRTAGGARAED